MSLWVKNGRGNGNFDWPVGPFPRGVISRDSIVLANICEIARIPGEPRNLPWNGDASMEIRNIIPDDNGFVTLTVEIDWDSPLDFRVFFVVFD
jgi:hypothetical protein